MQGLTLQAVSIIVAAVISSGLIGTVIGYWLNAQREDKESRRQRLERLFQALQGYMNQLGWSWVPYSMVMRGRIPYDEVDNIRIVEPISKEIEGSKSLQECGDEIQLLVAIYFPELEHLCARLEDIRLEGLDVLAVHKHNYKGGKTKDEKSLESMHDLTEKRDVLEHDFKNAIRREVAKISNPAWMKMFGQTNKLPTQTTRQSTQELAERRHAAYKRYALSLPKSE